jgi:subtilisin family serine protease
MRNRAGIPFLLLAGLCAACAPREAEEPKILPADVPKVQARIGPGADVCVSGAQKLAAPVVEVDADGDAKIDRIEMFQTVNYEYPLLARWKSHPAGRPQDAVWAVATHAVVTLLPGAKADKVKASFANRLGRNDLELVPLSLERTFLIGISPKSSGFATFGQKGELLAALPDLRASNASSAEIEPDYLFFPDKLPNDPKLNLQDELPPIHASAAWDVETGSNEVRIAVLDSGIERGHPSLKNSRILIVPGPPFSDLLRGDDDPDDELDHGTYCSAIAGAKGNDKKGMTGVNWDVTLMPVKFIDDQGCGTSSRAAEAVEYAIRNKADVISASWGGLGKSTRLSNAITDANKAGILFVASAGNSGLDLDTDDYFPASYNLPNMLVVGAADNNGSPVGSSGHGRLGGVHLSAPGDKVFSAVRVALNMTAARPFPYSDAGGTSPAVAFVSGAVAMVKARSLRLPSSQQLKPDQIRCRILKSTTPFSALAGSSCSGGLLNLENAVSGTSLRSVCGCP